MRREPAPNVAQIDFFAYQDTLGGVSVLGPWKPSCAWICPGLPIPFLLVFSFLSFPCPFPFLFLPFSLLSAQIQGHLDCHKRSSQATQVSLTVTSLWGS